MRILTIAALTTLIMPSIGLAADFDFGALRGGNYEAPDVVPVANWAGFYFGGYGGQSQSNFSNKNGSKDLIAQDFRNTTIESEYNISSILQLKSKTARDSSFGGFVGYNYQIDEMVLGFEADYTSTRLSGLSTDSIGRFMSTSDGYYNLVRLSGEGKTELRDHGTVRFRAGYTWGNLMPFVTAGVAAGRLTTTNSATVQYAAFDATANAAYLAAPATSPFPGNTGYTRFVPSAPTSFSCTAQTSCLAAPVTLTKSKSTVAVGFTAGAGLEYMLSQNIFVRGEYQYAFFDDYNGHKFNLNTVRAGGGVKF